jgi:hypothetical protein
VSGTHGKAPSEAIVITAEVAAICRQLGLEPSHVARLDIRPRKLVVEVYKLRNGKKYIENDEPAIESHTFEVRA